MQRICRYYFYIHPPKSCFNWLAFFAPFSLGIWICFLATILILPVLILLLHKWDINIKEEILNKESTIENVGKIFFEMFSLIVQQGMIIAKTRGIQCNITPNQHNPKPKCQGWFFLVWGYIIL